MGQLGRAPTRSGLKSRCERLSIFADRRAIDEHVADSCWVVRCEPVGASRKVLDASDTTRPDLVGLENADIRMSALAQYAPILEAE